MHLLLKVSESAAEGRDLEGGCQIPPLKAYMDDTKVLTSDVGEARKMLGRLDELIFLEQDAVQAKEILEPVPR
jgi:hypothetical protein